MHNNILREIETNIVANKNFYKMKRTLSVNIGGQVFHIDEDAFVKLDAYLKAINKKFANSPDGEEIITDIEGRIAELFRERLVLNKEVLTFYDVEAIIETMGAPDDFENSDNEPETTNTNTQQKNIFSNIFNKGDKSKKLFRDGKKRILGGVAAGMAHYLNIDPLFIRLAFVILSFITGFVMPVVYFILWAILPEAKTNTQVLEMQGKAVNIDNLEKVVKEEFNHVKETFSNFRHSDKFYEIRNQIYSFRDKIFNADENNLGNKLSKVIETFLISILKIIGFVFVAAGLFFLSVIAGLTVFGNTAFSLTNWLNAPISVPEALRYIVEPLHVSLGLAAIFILIGIPLILLIFMGTKILFNFRSNNKAILFSSFLVWLAGAGILFYVGMNTAGNFTSYGENLAATTLQVDKSKTIVLEAITTENDETQMSLIAHVGEIILVDVDNNQQFMQEPTFNIIQSVDSLPRIVVLKTAHNESERAATGAAHKINYQWEIVDTIVNFNSFFTFDAIYQWRNQGVSITMELPVGYSVFISESMRDIIFDIKNIYNMWDGDMVGKQWIMKPEGLALVDESLIVRYDDYYEEEIIQQEVENVDSVMNNLEQKMDNEMQIVDSVANNLN